MAIKRMAKFLACHLPEQGDGMRARLYQRSLFRFRILCLSVLLLAYGDYDPPFAAGEHKAPPLLPRELKLACLHGGKLYCVHIIDRYNGKGKRIADRFAKMEMWKAKITLNDGIVKEKQQMPTFTGNTAQEGVLFRWRISRGLFCWTGDKVGESVGFSCWPLNKISIPFDKLVEGFYVEGGFGAHLIPVMELVYRALSAGGKDLKVEVSSLDPWAIKDAFFDFLLGDKNEIHAFVAWRGKLRFWRGVIQDKAIFKKGDDVIKMHTDDFIKWDNAIPAKAPDSNSDARPVLLLDTEMREGFIAYQSKTHFFFVTVSGKLYACRKRGEQQQTELLWNDAHSPIRFVIHDTASQKTFAFTSAVVHADKPGRNVCFELAPKLGPIAYDPKKVPEWNPSDPLPTMMDYVRILLREKRIKVEK